MCSQEISEELSGEKRRALMRYIEEAISGGSCQEILEELSGDKRGAVRQEKKSCNEREKATSGEELSGKRRAFISEERRLQDKSCQERGEDLPDKRI
jgi:hypothetical protein